MVNEIIVVGIGHPLRGDDSLGPKAIEALKPLLPESVTSCHLLGDIVQLLDIFAKYAKVYLIDAMVTQRHPAGTRFRLAGEQLQALASSCRTSTHAFDIAQAIALATNLQCLPENLVIYGIEAKQFNHGQDLSPEVSAQLRPLIHELLEEINQIRRGNY